MSKADFARALLVLLGGEPYASALPPAQLQALAQLFC
jgi:hypothetical protein